jgi:hypothetical protein
MTKAEARRLCLLEMADRLVRDAVHGGALWASEDALGLPHSAEGRALVSAAAEELVQEWRTAALEAVSDSHATLRNRGAL